MTEHINDPCEEREIEEGASPEGPSIPPAQPQRLETPTEVFPQRQSEPIEQTTIRESVLIDEHYFEAGLAQNVLRLPQDTQSPDTFRFASGKVYQFENFELSFFNNSLQKNAQLGVPFNTSFSQTIRSIPSPNSRPFETQAVTLEFDKLMFGLLLNQTLDQYPQGSIETILFDFIAGSGEFSKSLVPSQGQDIFDMTLLAPAAFFETEAEQSSVPLVETVSCIPVVGNLPLQETTAPETSKASLYRLYSSIRRDDTSAVLSEDKVQKFDISAVRQINDINEQATNVTLQSQFFVDAEETLNNHMKIGITMNKESELCKILEMNGLDSVFMDFLGSSGNVSDREYVQIIDQSVLGGQANNTFTLDYKPKVYDFDAFLSNSTNNIFQTILFMSGVETEHPIPYFVNGAEDVRGLLDHAFFTGTPERSVNQLLQRKKRSLAGIMRGDRCYSEVVAYRIEKIRIGEDTEESEVVQEFYIFNDQETSSLTFLDTQVSYNKAYEYKIYAINLVVGNKLSYGQVGDISPETFRVPNPEISFSITSNTVLHLVETPYFSQQTRMIDKPPMYPQVEVIPFFQDAEKIGFRMTPTFGTMMEEPIEILEGDDVRANIMLDASTGVRDGKVEYSSDSQPTGYEMLIIDSVPYSYQDFSQAQRIAVDAVYNSGYIETMLTSNKRYYMIFRAYDASGISNPTTVFTLVLNSHADGVFIEFDEFDMVPRNLEEQITFERYLKIDPAPEQTAVDFPNHDQEGFYLAAPDVASLSLGVEDSKLWTKDFKFRLVSRTTGKAIDINVNYVFKVIEPPRESPFRRRDPVDLLPASGIRATDATPAGTVSRNVFLQDRNLPGVQTEYDEEGRPVRSIIQADPTSGYPGIGDN